MQNRTHRQSKGAQPNMELLDIIDLKQLQQMQDCFSQATGMAAVTVDRKGSFVTKPSNFTDFCMKYTRNSPLGAQRCAQCDAEGKGAYSCHAGLMDFAEPIIVDGVQYGNVLGGQVLPREPDEAQFRAVAQELGIPEDSYIEALRKVTVRSEQSIRASAALLRELVKNLVAYHFIARRSGYMPEMLEEISSMGKCSRDIASKARDLKRVSTQQRLLSINAAIEAGRAGDAGKGFRIVANQMGELAESSAAIYETIIEDSDNIYTSVKHLENDLKESPL